MTTHLSEILAEVEKAKHESDKIEVLRFYDDNLQFLQCLNLALDPSFQFGITAVPPHKPDGAPLGINPQTVFRLLKNVYVLFSDHPSDPETKNRIFIRMLESLNEAEALALTRIVLKRFDLYGITPKLVRKAYRDEIASQLLGSQPEQNATTAAPTSTIDLAARKATAVAKRKRGRPRKHPQPKPAAVVTPEPVATVEVQPATPEPVTPAPQETVTQSV